jgi:class 3 adenylate cyclase
MKSKNAVEKDKPDELLGVEKEVVILLSDMVCYSRKTTDMRPTEIKDFMLLYHTRLKEIVRSVCGKGQRIESSAGDGAVAVFERKAGQGKNEMCCQALDVALKMVYAMEKGLIAQTRIGLFTGHIIEAVLEGKIMRFGASFSVASRLEELCGYFGTRILMDREVAFWQTDHARYLVSIGKVTPKNFNHPVHLFSVYRPGIHQCPENVNKKQLQRFIELKNRAVELFCGNVLQGIMPDFPLARIKLLEAQEFFVEMTGKRDQPTERILEYIGNHPRPVDDFKAVGMKIGEPISETGGIHLLNLSSEFFKAIDAEFYQALVVDTEWERKFKLIWRKKGDCIIRFQDTPDGIYFIDNGSVSVLDGEGRLLNTLSAGDVFGEMAYFTKKGRRSATVIADTDLVLRRITGEDLRTMPVIRKIFKKIARKRKKTGE